MRKLRAKIRTAVASNTQVKATVIDTAPGKATVKLAGSGAILTMLPLAGGANVEVGNAVIVDYTGSSPLVRVFF